MASCKIAVVLHEGEKETKKIWRFNKDLCREYTKSGVLKEIGLLFPHVEKKGLQLELFHFDDLVGKVDIESDADLVEALVNFIEESKMDSCRSEYLALHVKDSYVSSTKASDETSKSSKSKISHKSRKRKVILAFRCTIYLMLTLT